MKTGETFDLKATVSPANASNKNVTWKSSNTSVATVTNGKVKAVGAGKTTITVTTADGSKTATCSVTVTEAEVRVTGVTLNRTSNTIYIGDSFTLTATVAPTNATNKNVTWKTSNSVVATVTNGVVKGLKEGTAIITVTTADGGKTASCTVTVKPRTIAVTGVSLSKTELTLTVGDSHTLTATVSPSNATNKNVTWRSSNTAVATVTNGVVKGLKEGTATITVTTADGGKTATCSVTVKPQEVRVTGVTLNKTSITLSVKRSYTLTATVNPDNATNKKVTWTSSDPAVATVNNGIVRGVSAGNAEITVRTDDGGFTATCSVKVRDADGGNAAIADDSPDAIGNGTCEAPDLVCAPAPDVDTAKTVCGGRICVPPSKTIAAAKRRAIERTGK